MPSLYEILRQTMLGTAAANGAVMPALSPGCPVPMPRNRALDEEDQPIWHYTWSAYDRITDLTCLTRSMDYMAMPVCESIVWEPVTVTILGVAHVLPLKAPYLIRSDYVPEGRIPESGSGFWQLEANIDQSFQHVFGYEIPPFAAMQPTRPETWDSPTFMAEAAGASPSVPAQAGQVATIGLAPVRIVVVVSFVCCKERADFEPQGVLGAGRLYPLVMVMANAPVDLVEANVRLARPATTPHTQMGDETMAPAIRGSFFTDNNEGGLPMRWPDFFSYYLIDPPLASYVGVDPARPARHVSGAVQACAESYLNPGLARGAWIPGHETVDKPARDVPFDKVAGQGEFDNLHLAPRMIAPAELLAARPELLSLRDIAMAPFCVHDCLHTHWRWGAGGDAKHVRGWLGMRPYAKPGAPLVPPNQKITIELTSPHAFRYHAEVRAPIPAGQWQVIFHHGSAYALHVDFGGKAAKLGLQFGPAMLSQDELPLSSRTGDGLGWAMLYWRLRYRNDLLGPQERIRITDAAKARG